MSPFILFFQKGLLWGTDDELGLIPEPTESYTGVGQGLRVFTYYGGYTTAIKGVALKRFLPIIGLGGMKEVDKRSAMILADNLKDTPGFFSNIPIGSLKAIGDYGMGLVPFMKGGPRSKRFQAISKLRRYETLKHPIKFFKEYPRELLFNSYIAAGHIGFEAMGWNPIAGEFFLEQHCYH